MRKTHKYPLGHLARIFRLKRDSVKASKWKTVVSCLSLEVNILGKNEWKWLTAADHVIKTFQTPRWASPMGRVNPKVSGASFILPPCSGTLRHLEEGWIFFSK